MRMHYNTHVTNVRYETEFSFRIAYSIFERYVRTITYSILAYAYPRALVQASLAPSNFYPRASDST